MSASEEKEFLDRVMKDSVLREAVETEKIIQTTLRKDREMEEHDESKMEAHVLGLLATIRSADGFSGANTTGTQSSSFSSGSSLLATGAAKFISAVIVTLGLSTGVYFVAQNSWTDTIRRGKRDMGMQSPPDNVSSPGFNKSTNAKQFDHQQKEPSRMSEPSGTFEKQKDDEVEIFLPQLNPNATKQSTRNSNESRMSDSLQMKLKVDLDKVKRLHGDQD